MLRSTIVGESFECSFGLYRDLLEVLDEVVLGSKLPGLRSNAVGGQLWCVIGARESYARAFAAGTWAGFSCSLEVTGDPAKVAEALARSEAAVSEAIGRLSESTAAQERLVLDLLEHEAQHHGQLIRYLYALKLEVPASWKARYALD